MKKASELFGDVKLEDLPMTMLSSCLLTFCGFVMFPKKLP